MSGERPTQSVPEEERGREYGIAPLIFIGVMLIIMGLLVLATLLVANMPEDHPWNPAVMDISVAILYLVIGGYVLYRARRRAKKSSAEASADQSPRSPT